MNNDYGIIDLDRDEEDIDLMVQRAMNDKELKWFNLQPENTTEIIAKEGRRIFLTVTNLPC